MKRIVALIAVAVLAICASVQAQVTIPGTTKTMRIDAEDWRYLRTFEVDDGANVYLFYYIGHTVVDAGGDTVLPSLRIYVNEHYDADVYTLAYDRYMKQPFQSLNEYTRGLGLPKNGGLGYDGIYTNPVDGKDYRLLMTYFKEKNTIVEIRLETTNDTFGDMEFEFKDVLGTLK